MFISGGFHPPLNNMEWKTVKLGDVCDLIAGFAFKAKDFGDYPQKVVKIGDITPPYVSYNSMAGIDMTPYSVERLQKYKVVYDDFVLAMTGATIGKVGRYINEDFAYLNQRVLLFKPHKDVCAKYIYFLVCAREFQMYVQNHIDSESAQPNISANTLSKYTFSLPPLAEQKRIAAILSSLDAKIENNNRINANLEAQAQALYKSWFIDFEPWGGKMPEDWKEGKLTDIAELFDSKRIPLSGMQRSKMEKIYPYYGATSIMDYVDNYIFDGIYLLMGEDGSVVTEDGFPYLQYVEGKFWCNNHAHIMQGRNGYSTEMLYCLLKQTKVAGIVTGAVQGKISQTSMQKIQCVIPPQNICERMTKCMDVFFEHIRMINKESQRLAQLRDTLLPKLMKGEIAL